MGLNEFIQIGEKLKQARIAAGYKQKDFAKLLNLPISTLANYENGHREPNKEIIEKIASKLNISIEELLYNHIELKPVDEFEAFLRFLGYKVTSLETPDQYKAEFNEYPSEDYLMINGHRLTKDDIEKLCLKLKNEIDYYLKWKW